MITYREADSVVPEGIHSMQATAGSATAGINVAALDPTQIPVSVLTVSFVAMKK
jgi:hypothetical protein